MLNVFFASNDLYFTAGIKSLLSLCEDIVDCDNLIIIMDGTVDDSYQVKLSSKVCSVIYFFTNEAELHYLSRLKLSYNVCFLHKNWNLDKINLFISGLTNALANKLCRNCMKHKDNNYLTNLEISLLSLRFNGYSYEEISVIKDFKLKTAYNKLNYALRKINVRKVHHMLKLKKSSDFLMQLSWHNKSVKSDNNHCEYRYE